MKEHKIVDQCLGAHFSSKDLIETLRKNKQNNKKMFLLKLNLRSCIFFK